MLPQVNNCFIPTEGAWLNGTRLAICGAIRDLWLQISDLNMRKHKQTGFSRSCRTLWSGASLPRMKQRGPRHASKLRSRWGS